jgi:hypothetical protein
MLLVLFVWPQIYLRKYHWRLLLPGHCFTYVMVSSVRYTLRITFAGYKK